MKIVKQPIKVKCDFASCKNIASYSIIKNDEAVGQYFNVCEDCLRNMYCVIGDFVDKANKEKVAEKHKKYGGKK